MEVRSSINVIDVLATITRHGPKENAGRAPLSVYGGLCSEFSDHLSEQRAMNTESISAKASAASLRPQNVS